MSPNKPSLYQRIGGREKIAVLLRHFYADVRQHQVIGPIFNRQIRDWPVHLAKIGEFWARLSGGPSNFVGSLPHKHAPLDLADEHFNAWLGLWEVNCRCYLPPAEGAEMIQLAHTIGRRLKMILLSDENKNPGPHGPHGIGISS